MTDMTEPWLTYAAVLFGVAVAIAGVAAYLRMTRAAGTDERNRNESNRVKRGEEG